MTSSKYVLQIIYLLIYLFLSLVVLTTWTSCQSEKKNSILILAFDRLPSDAISCSDDRPIENSGFNSFCKESIRFTHSYTTSLQPAAAIASILTGEYPHQHKLHRSFDRISEKSILASQLAFEEGLRTSFFSGSPSILKKTGLSTFFDLFDDSSAITQKNFYKDFKLQSTDFFDWYKEDPNPFFSIIYNSELEFLKNEDPNAIEKLDEKLSVFFEKLKAEKMWNSTEIFLVGLNGTSRFGRINESSFQNLHSENTQIATLIKRPRSGGDEGINWKNDTPVQLADIGKTIKYLLKPFKQEKASTESPFNIYNLIDLLNLKNKIELKQRSLLIEAPNTWTKNLNWIHFAILTDQYLYIDSNKPSAFNTLTDRMETTNLYSKKDLFWNTPTQILQQIKKELKISGHLNKSTKEFGDYENKFSSSDKLQLINFQLENNWGLLNYK